LAQGGTRELVLTEYPRVVVEGVHCGHRGRRHDVNTVVLADGNHRVVTKVHCGKRKERDQLRVTGGERPRGKLTGASNFCPPLEGPSGGVPVWLDGIPIILKAEENVPLVQVHSGHRRPGCLGDALINRDIR